jgi:hypothetical protein
MSVANVNVAELTKRVVMLREQSCATASAELQRWEVAKGTHEQNNEGAFPHQVELDAALKKLQKELTEYQKAQALASSSLPGVKLPMQDANKPTLYLDKGLTEKKTREFFTKVRAFVLKHGGGDQDPESLPFGQRSVCIEATKKCISNFSDLTEPQLEFFNGRDCQKWSLFQDAFVQFFAGVKTTSFDAGDEFLTFRQGSQGVDTFNAEHKRMFMRTLDEPSEQQYVWQTANSGHRLQYLRCLNAEARSLVIDNQETFKKLSITKSMSQLMEAVAAAVRAEEGRKRLHQQGNGVNSKAKEFPPVHNQCKRCGRTHKGGVQECRSTSDKNGQKLDPPKEHKAKKPAVKPVFDACTRCGRTHKGSARSCWSTTDKDGQKIDSAPTAHCPMRCNGCGQKGGEPASHIRSNCPKGAAMKRVRQVTIDNTSPSKKKKPACFNCGGTGHYQNQCPSAAVEDDASDSQ